MEEENEKNWVDLKHVRLQQKTVVTNRMWNLGQISSSCSFITMDYVRTQDRTVTEH